MIKTWQKRRNKNFVGEQTKPQGAMCHKDKKKTNDNNTKRGGG